MPKITSPYAVYHSMLEPWTRLATGSPDVVNLRLVAMPWLWISDPMQASREMQQMITEKHEALSETIVAISQTPMQLWVDIMSACWSANPCQSVNEAFIDSSQRLAYPSNSRVLANQERLGTSR
ncbi:hypothetical protein [Granulosicoccus antarcticus]|uniref:Uncharacterized protein n=1 Tax=Granulosicoccus antarcticus IMCC3135 TaxID=1192854 RepID=A0A2Z2NSE2_9GAMM|nr:hypothetical protein [Granulosicoccus antarcticus]ASJ72658.1 hypothetical protein IMCC3135_12850 [Granulosicoccus antarcticus IMCC3135]